MRLYQRVLTRLQDEPNVLLYGPPGTGKTHAMKALQNKIAGNGDSTSSEEADPGSQFDPDEVEFPFRSEAEDDDSDTSEPDFPGEIKPRG